jgi:hypothetical protein
LEESDTSPQLFWDLFQLGTYATGTVRQNRRGIPQTLKDYQLRNRGDIFVMNNGPTITFVKETSHHVHD